jgi:hypothetical protein
MIPRHLGARVALACSLIAALAGTASAADVEFPAPSPAATVKQKVGLTDVEVVYSRPGVKDRKIFGAMIPYGEVWRTGANAATRVSFSTDVTLGGAKLAAGTYELFTIPGKTEWTIIVQKLPEKASWGAYAYKPGNDTARVKTKAMKTGAPVESFTIGFDDLHDTGATMFLEWERTRVPVKLEVDTVGMLTPKIHEAIAAGGDKTWNFYYGAASLLFNNGGDSEQALKWVDESIKLRAGYPGTLLLKTRILVKLGRKDEAKAAAAQTVESGLKLEGPDSVMARQAKDIAKSLK